MIADLQRKTQILKGVMIDIETQVQEDARVITHATHAVNATTSGVRNLMMRPFTRTTFVPPVIAVCFILYVYLKLVRP